MDELLTSVQISEQCQVPLETIRRWRHKGVGPPSFRIGRHVRYRRDLFEAWLREQEEHEQDRDRARVFVNGSQVGERQREAKGRLS